MKKFLFWIMALILAVGLYIPCRSVAVSERGNKTIGGEVVIPLAVILGAMCLSVDRERTDAE